MSKGVKMVVGVAAAIAIPFAAPYIAGAIGASLGITAASFGVSAAVGATLGSAAVGAALGAGASAVLGQNIGRGALMGGIGGGVGGYASAANAATAVPPSGSTLSLTGGGTSLAEGGAGLALPTTSTGLSSVYDAGTGITPGLTGTGGLQSTTGTSSIFAPGASSTGIVAGDFSSGLTGPATFTSSAAPGLSEVPAQSSIMVPGASATGITAAPTTTAAVAPTTTAAGAAAAPGAGAAQPKTFMEALKALPGEIANKFTDPKTLADLTLRAAGQLAGSAVAGDGLSGEERGLLDTQTAELKELQKNNVALFNERIEQARGLVGESKYFDPEYFGLQRARRTQIAGATAKRAGLRGLEGGRRTAEGRRFDLATARDTGTAFDQGFGAGVQGRLATTQAGLSLYPASYPSSMGDYMNLSRAYDTAENRKIREQSQIGTLFGSLTGRVEDNTPARRT
jgi:hypothetical protein